MNEELILKKIQALLHDPPEKALILGKVSHKDRALSLMKMIEEGATITDETREADQIASAADRINFPKEDIETKVDFSKEPLIVHPLSGKEFKIPRSVTVAISGIDYKEVMKNVDSAIKEIALKYEDLKLKYLSLWGELQEIIKSKEEGSSALQQLWELLPADTRIPDHSIWEHRRVTSAIAGALPQPAFLLFSIGPIQEFIATARKTQDLWAGSYMLAYISWNAMKVICEKTGPDSVIFPDLTAQPFCDLWLKEEGLNFREKPDMHSLSLPTLPHRILALLPERVAEEIARKAEEAVNNVFKEICLAVKERVEKELNELKDDKVWNKIWERQASGFLETYWAILPMGKKDEYKTFLEIYEAFVGKEGLKEFQKLLKEYKKAFTPNIGIVYGKQYNFLEKTHGSRKILRNFTQTSEHHYKCTICGIREPVHPEKHNNKSCEEYGALVGFWRERVHTIFPDIKTSERLCAVCLTKRFCSKFYFKDKKNFNISTTYPSTSMMATSAFKWRVIKNLNKPELLTRVNNYLTTIEALLGEERIKLYDSVPMIKGACKEDIAKRFSRIDGDWLYIDTFKESLKDDLPTYSEELLKSCVSALKDLLDITKDMDIGTPSKYYAIIRMDGDNMGKWLSGEKAPQIEKILHPEIRNQLISNSNWQELLKQKRPLNPSLHIAISKALRDFSLKTVREIVERDHLGKLIYAGGDDVLAFVSLRDLLKVMRRLRAYFSGALTTKDGKIEIDFKDGSGFIPTDNDNRPLSLDKKEDKIKGFLYSMGLTATASMGVAIVHHSYDLRRALEDAREAEKRAKDNKGRNAFYISLIKRAGAPETFGSKWYFEEDNFEVIPVMEKLLSFFSNEKGLSPRFAHDYMTELLGLQGIPDAAVEKELIRLAKRHLNIQNREEKDKKAQEIVRDLTKLKANNISLEEILGLLNICTFLARRENR